MDVEQINGRMEALLRRMAARWSYTEDSREFSVVAGEIMRDLDRLRDPDIAAAERIARGYCGGANVDAVLNGIKHGREQVRP